MAMKIMASGHGDDGDEVVAMKITAIEVIMM